MSVGGQAVIEGVMMRYRDNIAIAMRTNKGIKVVKEKVRDYSKERSFWAWPFFRGIISLGQMLYYGSKALIISANEQTEGDEKFSTLEVIVSVIFAVGFSLLIFVLLPYLLTYLGGFSEKKPVLFNLIDGFIKLLILLGYVWVIGLMKDVKRVFQYHGAEHKAVHVYEHKLKLNYNNSKKFSTIHMRCGTNFLAIVIMVGIILFSLIPLLTALLIPGFMQFNSVLRYSILVGARLLFFPIIAGVSYEWLRFSGKFENLLLFRILNLPGLLFQKLTTKEPSKDQIEVAFAALKAVVPKNTYKE